MFITVSSLRIRSTAKCAVCVYLRTTKDKRDLRHLFDRRCDSRSGIAFGAMSAEPESMPADGLFDGSNTDSSLPGAKSTSIDAGRVAETLTSISGGPSINRRDSACPFSAQSQT